MVRYSIKYYESNYDVCIDHVLMNIYNTLEPPSDNSGYGPAKLTTISACYSLNKYPIRLHALSAAASIAVFSLWMPLQSTESSLVPRPHPLCKLWEIEGLVSYVNFLGLEAISLHKNGRLKSDWSMLKKIHNFDSWQLVVSYVDLKVPRLGVFLLSQ